MMRTMLTKALSTRITPFLKFHMDENLKKELEIQELLAKVAAENARLTESALKKRLKRVTTGLRRGRKERMKNATKHAEDLRRYSKSCCVIASRSRWCHRSRSKRWSKAR